MLNDDDIALAGEYVLGLLDTAGDAQVSARIATDGDFAAEVEAWRQRLQSMLGTNDVETPSQVWNAISGALPQETGQDVGTGNIRFWKTLTGISASAAILLAILLLQRPDAPIAPAPETPMIAALGGETGNMSLTASYEANSGRMIITPVSLDTGELYPELWIIPADGTPRSLGIVNSTQATAVTIPASLRPHMSAGGTLAITPEPEGGGPGGKPSGPVIASGKITTI